MMLVYPSAPQLGRQTRITTWTCAQCGCTKYANAILRQNKYCNRHCFALAQAKRMSGAGNPAYTGGRKLRKSGRNDRAYTRIPKHKAKAVMQWVEARAALGTAEDIAARLGLPKQAVYHVASHYRRKLSEAIA